MRVKGVILAAGRGTRLRPFTEVINKHLLPVGCEPMIYWPLRKLKEAGINDILLVTNGRDLQDFQTLLGDGSAFGVQLAYEVQKEARGIADALFYARDFASFEPLFVYLGDNIYFGSLKDEVAQFCRHPVGAHIFLKKVPDPERYGIAVVDEQTGSIMEMEEKPVQPKSNLCITGLYMYDVHLFDIIRHLKPSARGELEITDVNRAYLSQRKLSYRILTGDWIDAGTPQSLYAAAELAFSRKAGTTWP